MSTAPRAETDTVTPLGFDPLGADPLEFLRQRDAFMAAVFVEGIHFGSATGEEKQEARRDGKPQRPQKRDLLLPGAQALLLFLRAHDEIHEEKWELVDGHVEWKVRVDLVHDRTGLILGQGIGTSTTMEKKHRWRYDSKKCPECGAEAILESRDRPEWFCWGKKGGCGAKFKKDDDRITHQKVGQSQVDGWDTRNTACKIAYKRSLMSAVITKCALSDHFNQDLDDLHPQDRPDRRPARQPAPQRREPEPPPRDEAKARLNEQFQPGESRGSSPWRGEPAAEVPETNTAGLDSYLAATLFGKNKEWRELLETAGKDASESLFRNTEEIVLGVIGAAVDRKAVKALAVTENGRLDPDKCRNCLAAFWHHKDQQRVKEQIGAYVDRVWSDRARKVATQGSAPESFPQAKANLEKALRETAVL